MLKNHFKYFLLLVAIIAVPAIASAHQPRYVKTNAPIVIENPEISKAYYGKLTGEPQVFTISSEEPFKFYMNVLVPDVPGAKKDVSAALIDPKNPDVPLAVVGGADADWQPYFEEFARDNYFRGPEIRKDLPGGNYEIRVWSSNNDSAYSLAVGETESFPLSEILNAYVALPQIKSAIFGKSALSAFLTPVLGVPILALIILVIAVVVLIRWIRRRIRAKTVV